MCGGGFLAVLVCLGRLWVWAGQGVCCHEEARLTRLAGLFLLGVVGCVLV